MGSTGQGDGDRASTLVSVAIVGAQKCGTTTLAAMLNEHPLLCLAKDKEAHLFDSEAVQQRGLVADDIERWWPHRLAGQMLLDATPSYLYLPGCLEALVRHNPDVRIIVMLRPAGQRAISHHRHELRRDREWLSLGLALVVERWRLRRDRSPLDNESAHRKHSLMDRGRYSTQLQRLHSMTANVHVTTLADLVHDPEGEMQRMFGFLGVQPIPVSKVPHLNRGGRRPRLVWRALLSAVTRREMIATARELGWPEKRLLSERRPVLS